MKSIEELPAFLHKKYEAFVKFYKNIHSEYHESYPEVFNLNIETEPKELAQAELIRVFSRVVTLETYNFNKSSLDKIKTMLNQKGLNTDLSIDKAIEKGNFKLLGCLLNYGNTKIASSNLNKAIEKGDLAILKAVLEHSTTKIEFYNLDKAIEKGNLALAILKAVLEHSTTKIESYSLNKVIEKGDLDILKAVLEHPTIEVNSYTISTAEETHNLEIIELVKNYSAVNTITSEETTIDTALTVVEEVPALGEGIEGA